MATGFRGGVNGIRFLRCSSEIDSQELSEFVALVRQAATHLVEGSRFQTPVVGRDTYSFEPVREVKVFAFTGCHVKMVFTRFLNQRRAG